MPDYPRHLSDFDYVGFHRYFLTFCTFERNPYFRDVASVALLAEQFLHASGEQSTAITTYCFMPDHVHLLVQFSSGQPAKARPPHLRIKSRFRERLE